MKGSRFLPNKALPFFAIGFATLLLMTGPSQAADAKYKAFDDNWFFYGAERPEKLKVLEGKAAPKLKLKDWIGAQQDLAKLKGKIVVVDFWATWCGPCRTALPKNVALVDKYKSKGVVLLGVHDSGGGADKMPAMAADKKINYSLAVDIDGVSTKAWNVHFWPTYFVIDRQGIIRAAGLRASKVENVIKALLDEKA